MMPAWQMYGHLYYKNKLKPLVDEAHEAIRMEYKHKLLEGNNGVKLKKPQRVQSWAAVVKAQYALESEDVKKEVRDALKEHAKMIKIANEPLLADDDEDSRMAKLDA